MMAASAASAVSGGAAAGSGETVVTGDSSASVQVTNVIYSNSEGGTSQTIIEKTVDGVTTREEETKEYAPGEPIEVDVSVEAMSGGETVTQTTSDKSGASVAESALEASTTAEISSSTDVVADISVVSSIGNFVKETFSKLVEGFLSFWN